MSRRRDHVVASVDPAHAPAGNGYVLHPACLPAQIREIPRAFAREQGAPAPKLGGIRIQVGARLPAGATVEVSTEICGRTERFRGTVHWVRPAGRRFEAAIRLTDPEQAYRARTIEQACQIEAYRRLTSRREGRAIGVEQAAARWIAKHARRFARAWERPTTLLAD